MSHGEKLFGNVMLGVLAGLTLWAVTGSMFSMYFRDDLKLLGHYSTRAASYVDSE